MEELIHEKPNTWLAILRVGIIIRTEVRYEYLFQVEHFQEELIHEKPNQERAFMSWVYLHIRTEVRYEYLFQVIHLQEELIHEKPNMERAMMR